MLLAMLVNHAKFIIQALDVLKLIGKRRFEDGKAITTLQEAAELANLALTEFEECSGAPWPPEQEGE